MNTNNINTAAQESSERWMKTKNMLTARLFHQSEQIRQALAIVSDEKEAQRLERLVIAFAKTRAKLDAHCWSVCRRSDPRVITVWKLTSSHIQKTLGDFNYGLCQKLEKYYYEHIFFLKNLY